MSERLLRAIVSRLSSGNRAGFLAEVHRQEEKARNVEPFLRQIREAPTRAQVAAVLAQLRKVPFAVEWSDVNAAIREKWSASGLAWISERASAIERQERAERLEARR